MKKFLPICIILTCVVLGILVAKNQNTEVTNAKIDDILITTNKNINEDTRISDLSKNKNIRILSEDKRGFFTFSHSYVDLNTEAFDEFVLNNDTSNLKDKKFFKGQNTSQVFGNGYEGNLSQYFFELLDYKSNWFDFDCLNISKGQSTTYFKSKKNDDKYARWSNIVESKDFFTFTFAKVKDSLLGSQVIIGGDNKESGIINNGHAYTVKKTNNSSKLEIKWQNYNDGNYYARGYSGIACISKDINSYTHNSYAMVQFAPGQVYCIQANNTRNF